MVVVVVVAGVAVTMMVGDAFLQLRFVPKSDRVRVATCFNHLKMFGDGSTFSSLKHVFGSPRWTSKSFASLLECPFVVRLSISQCMDGSILVAHPVSERDQTP